MDDSEEMPSKLWLVLLLTILLILVAALAVLFHNRAPSATQEPPPLATADFDRAGTVEISAAELGTELWWNIAGTDKPWWRGTSSTGTSATDWGDYGYRLEKSGGEISRVAMTTNSTALSIRLRITEPLADGPPEWVISRDQRLGEVSYLDGKFRMDKYRKTDELPSFYIEVEDGAGGWRPMPGPFFLVEGEPVAFSTTAAFPRGTPTLKLRLNQTDQEPVVVEIPNPAGGSAAQSWSPDPLPAVREFEPASIHLTEVSPPTTESIFPEIQISITPTESTQDESSFTIDQLDWSDAWRNKLGYRNNETRPLPGTTTLRVAGSAMPSHTYRYNRADCVPVITGEWDGKGWKLSTTPEGLARGIDTIDVTLPPDDQEEMRHSARHIFILKGEGPKSEFVPPFSNWEKRTLAFFIDGAETSDGDARSFGVGSGHSGPTLHFDRNDTWDPTVPLTKGMQIEMMITPHIPDMPFEFFVPYAAPSSTD